MPRNTIMRSRAAARSIIPDDASRMRTCVSGARMRERMLSSMLSAIVNIVPIRMTASMNQRKLSTAMGPGLASYRPAKSEARAAIVMPTRTMLAMPTARWWVSLSGRHAAQRSSNIAPPMSTSSGRRARMSCAGRLTSRTVISAVPPRRPASCCGGRPPY